MPQREARAVPAGWEHPRDADGRLKPMYSYPDLVFDLANRDANPQYFVDDEPLDPGDYMPPVPPGGRAEYVLYETVTPGTPESPAFESLDLLAAWCEKNADIWAGKGRQSRAAWLALFREDLKHHPRGPRPAASASFRKPAGPGLL